MQGADVEPRRGLVGVVDPHRHVDHVQLPQPALLEPLPGLHRRRREPVVEVDAVGQAHLAGQPHQAAGLGDLVGDRLLPQHRDPRLQQLHRRRVVVAAVLHPRRGDAGGVDGEAAVEHAADAVERLRPVGRGRRVGPLLADVAHGHHLGVGVGLVAPGVVVADAAHPHDGDPKLLAHPLPPLAGPRVRSLRRGRGGSPPAPRPGPRSGPRRCRPPPSPLSAGPRGCGASSRPEA